MGNDFSSLDDATGNDSVMDLTYTYEDFDQGRVFEYLISIQDEFNQMMEENRMARLANSIKFTDFKRLWRAYKKKHEQKRVIPQEDMTSGISDQPIGLSTGEWHVDDDKVWKFVGKGFGDGGVVTACAHPIMPVERIRSIDTNLLKYKIWFRRGGVNGPKREQTFTIDASDMASPNDLVKVMAPYGISISGGERAKAMTDYLRDMTDLNYDMIPEKQSISRMGWNEGGFAPYQSGVEFDSATAFAGVYKALTVPAGSFEGWLEEALEARTYSITSRIVLAASFSAPLVEKLGSLSYFVHLWSTASGTGKTVGQMLGASVWGDPLVGGAFFPTFRSTSVGVEMMAGFLHSIPLFIDELQLAKDHHGKVQFNVYELASGSGKLRSNRSLGLNYTPQWATCFITSGETPIVSDTDGEGAINRVIEIECYANEKVIRDGHKTANALKANYGHAGRMFVEKLMERTDVAEADSLVGLDGTESPVEYPNINLAKSLYEDYFQQCTRNDTTDKQAMAAAVILTADHLATEWIFHDGRQLTVEEISEFLKTKERVSMMDRGYDILCDWVAVNENKLKWVQDEDRGECYGVIQDGVAYIIRSVFNRVCMENEINPKGLLSHLKSHDLVKSKDGRFDVTKRLGQSGALAHCVALVLPVNEETDLVEDDEPF